MDVSFPLHLCSNAEGLGGPAIRHEGSPIRKKNVSLGGPTFYRYTDVITLPLLHLLLRVRLLWFVSAKTRRFSQNSAVFEELDRYCNKNSMVFAEFDRSRSKNSTVFAELFCMIRHHYVSSLADSFSSLYCHSVNLC